MKRFQRSTRPARIARGTRPARAAFGAFSALAGAAALLASTGAAAQDNRIGVGVVRIDNHARSAGVQGIGVPPGANTTTGDATTAVLSYERMLTPNWGAELVLGVPPRVKAYGTGSVAFLGEMVSVREISPTLFANYRFGSADATLRPSIGVGINYTRFASIRSRYASEVSMSDSIGPAVKLGLDWRLGNNLWLSGTVTALKVESDLVAVGTTVLQSTVDFRPRVYGLTLIYGF